MVHRAEFIDILLRHLPKHVNVHNSKHLRTIFDRSGGDLPIYLGFSDDTEAQADALVGADGIDSFTRCIVLDSPAVRFSLRGYHGGINAQPSGTTVYRAIIPRDELTQLVSPDSSVWTSASKVVRFEPLSDRGALTQCPMIVHRCRKGMCGVARHLASRCN